MKDMMAGFELHQPADLEAALDLLDRYGEDAWRLAGGYDLSLIHISEPTRPY